MEKITWNEACESIGNLIVFGMQAHPLGIHFDGINNYDSGVLLWMREHEEGTFEYITHRFQNHRGEQDGAVRTFLTIGHYHRGANAMQKGREDFLARQ
jgi:hypothetical protein